MPLDKDEIEAIDRRIQRAGAANCWTGSLGTLATDARRLVRHIQGRDMDYPSDHILRGEAELRRTQYLGDEMDILTEEDAADVKEETRKAADLGGGVVPAVDEVASRKAAALAGGEPIRPGTDAFLGVLQEIAALHIRKSKDYGVDEDALANIRAGGEAIGVDPWKGCVLRISDKMQRLKAFCRRGECEFDGVEDTLADIAAYAAIALVMYREASAPPPG